MEESFSPWEWSPNCTGDVRTCPEEECLCCGARECPQGDPLHFDAEGCPACAFEMIPEQVKP